MNTFLRRNFLELFSLALISTSIFYFLGAQQKKRELLKGQTDQFEDKQIVIINEIIDGDELQLISESGAKSPLRLLGIMSFHQSISDKLEKKYAKSCIDYLNQRTLRQKALLRLPHEKEDSKKRLLGELFLRDKEGEYTINLAKELVSKGYSLVYTKYDFPKMDEFQKSEDKAAKELLGFWSNEQMKRRIVELKMSWEENKAK